MKTLKLLSILLILLPAPCFAAIENYVLDTDHTYVTWSVNHFGYSKVTGKVFAQGKLMLDRNNLAASQLHVTLDTDTPNTGVAHLNKALKGRNFFDTSQYPTASFVSNKIVITDKNSATVTGKLTIRNISKPITLKVTLNKDAKHPLFNRQIIGFHATATLKRSNFGMLGYLPGVSDEVQLDIQAEVTKQKAKINDAKI